MKTVDITEFTDALTTHENVPVAQVMTVDTWLRYQGNPNSIQANLKRFTELMT